MSTALDETPTADPKAMEAQRQRATKIKQRLSASLRGDGPAGDDTTEPPEPWRSSPLWNPEAVRHVITDNPHPSLGCPGLTYKGERRETVLMPHESPPYRVIRDGGLAAPDGRHHAKNAGLRAPGDIDETTAAAWLQRGDIKASRRVTIMFFRWGALSGLPYQNTYRLALHLDVERAALYLSGYQFAQSIRGPRDQIQHWPMTKESVAILVSDGLYQGDLQFLSLPAPRDPLPQVEWCASHYPEWLLVRFEWAGSRARSYEPEQRAMNLQADGRGRILDPDLLSLQYRQTLAREGDERLERSRRQEAFQRSQYVSL
jgi:hypothetical protein